MLHGVVDGSRGNAKQMPSGFGYIVLSDLCRQLDKVTSPLLVTIKYKIKSQVWGIVLHSEVGYIGLSPYVVITSKLDFEEVTYWL